MQQLLADCAAQVPVQPLYAMQRLIDAKFFVSPSHVSWTCWAASYRNVSSANQCQAHLLLLLVQ